jgi:FemAB-related protein (PEP-CTERM system-associated)
MADDEGLLVRLLERGEKTRWNRFVESCPCGTFFHLAEWQGIFERELKHVPYYLLAERSGEIIGVLPLVLMRSRLFGTSVRSLPFLAYGGALAHDVSVLKGLEESAELLAKYLGADHLELRYLQPTRSDWPTRSDYVTFRKEIPPTIEACMKSIPRKQRAMIRKGIGKGLSSEWDDTTNRFYAIFSESYRNLGTPALGENYFAAIKRIFGDRCRILTVLHSKKPVASVMTFQFEGELIPYYGGGTSAARTTYANDFMYWELLRNGCEEGAELFDFGRSRVNSGSYRFKKHWGFSPQPLAYQTCLLRGRPMPNLSPGNSKFSLAISLWKRMPLALTRVLGPPIARTIPG